MNRLDTILVSAMLATPAFAQVGVPGPTTANSFLPNFYNRQTQPLSPYLNLLRGTNLGVNYFYGVRPGLPSGGQPLAGAGGRVPYTSNVNPQFGPASTGQMEPGEGYVLPPAGHTNTYGNYIGTAGSSLPGYSFNRGAIAPGLANNPRPQAAANRPNAKK